MKFIICFLVVMCSSMANGQGLFFDNIKGSEWYTHELFVDSVTFSQKEMTLADLPNKEKNLSPIFDLWAFNDDNINIYRYDSTLNALSTVRRFRYEIIEEKAKKFIRIYPSYTQEYIDYEVGIDSTGSFIVLYKRKDKKKK